MLVKLYGESPEAEKRYSPAVCIGARKTLIEGEPDPISRSIVLFRLTSVGCAVSTGQTMAFVKKFCSLDWEMAASRARVSAWAMVASRGAEAASAWALVRRM
jgi:hypothetical protein